MVLCSSCHCWYKARKKKDRVFQPLDYLLRKLYYDRRRYTTSEKQRVVFDGPWQAGDVFKVRPCASSTAIVLLADSSFCVLRCCNEAGGLNGGIQYFCSSCSWYLRNPDACRPKCLRVLWTELFLRSQCHYGCGQIPLSHCHAQALSIRKSAVFATLIPSQKPMIVRKHDYDRNPGLGEILKDGLHYCIIFCGAPRLL